MAPKTVRRLVLPGPPALVVRIDELQRRKIDRFVEPRRPAKVLAIMWSWNDTKSARIPFQQIIECPAGNVALSCAKIVSEIIQNLMSTVLGQTVHEHLWMLEGSIQTDRVCEARQLPFLKDVDDVQAIPLHVVQGVLFVLISRFGHRG